MKSSPFGVIGANRNSTFIFACLAVLILTSPGVSHAQFVLDRSVTAGGGGTFTSRNFSLDGTLGQLSTGQASGSGFVLSAGYWGRAVAASGTASPSTIAVTVPVSAQPLGTLAVQIQIGDVAGGQPAVDLYDLVLSVDYDPARVAFRPGSFSVGGFLDPSGGANSVAQPPLDDPSNGRLTLDVSRTGSAGVTGEGMAASLAFDVLAHAAPGPFTLTLSAVQVRDASGAEIPLTPTYAPTDILGVWPGDANSNCTVDIMDVPALFRTFGNTGPARLAVRRATWAAQGYSPWTPATDTWVDGNGDGTIDLLDALPIRSNWGESRFGLPGSGCAPPSVGASASDVEVPVTAVGDSVVVELLTGDVLEDLLGIAFELQVPDGLFRVASAGAGSLIDDGNLITFDSTDAATGLFSAAYGRKGISAATTGAGLLTQITLEVIGQMDGPATLNFPRIALAHVGGETTAGPEILAQIADPTGAATGVATGLDLPTDFALKGAYPNPFNPTTTLVFDLPEAAEVTVLVYNLLGREVRRLDAGQLSAGANQAVRFEAGGLSSGMYLYRVLRRQGRTVQVLAGTFVLMK